MRDTTLKRKKKAIDTTDLEHQAAGLLKQGHSLVAKWCSIAHVEAVDRWKRFPSLHRSDPRSAELARLNKEHRQLKKRLRPGMPNDRRRSIQTQLDDIMVNAMNLLEGTESGGQAQEA